MSRIQELEQLITKASQAYYGDESEPIMDDRSFDALVAELRGLDPENSLLNTPGTGYVPKESHLQKFRHSYFTGSLDKLKWEDIQRGRRWTALPKLVASTKLDGGSAVAYYAADGQLIRVLSRGDGETGLDITQNVLNIPKKIWATGRPEAIRGELVVTWEDFELHLSEKSHPRNVACGLSQSIHADPKNLKLIRFIAYSIFDFDGSKLGMLNTLEMAKFDVVPYTVFTSFDDFVSAVRLGSYKITQESVLKNGQHLPYDGTVLTVDSNPEEQIAIKFEEESADTEIVSFEWNVSRTGRVVPTAILKSVNLAGACISRATCNNFAWVLEMGLYAGAKVRIIRANEIIPSIVANYDQSFQTVAKAPETCPVCGKNLEMRGRDLMCYNELCNSKIFAVFDRIMTVSPVDGIGPTTLAKFYELYNIRTLAQLKHQLHLSTLKNFQVDFGESMGQKLFELRAKVLAYTPTVGAYFWMANIPRIGDGSTEKFDRAVGPEEFVKVLTGEIRPRPEKWHEITGDFMGLTGQQIQDRYHDRLQDLYSFFDKRIRQRRFADKPSTKVKFSLTGTLSNGRDELVAEFAKFGCVFVSTSKAEVFIANAASSSSKYQEAAKRGIPIMTEAEFRTKYLGV